MPAPARGREEQGEPGWEAALSRLNRVARPSDPPFAPEAWSIADAPARAIGPERCRSDLKLVAEESFASEAGK